jgi:tRNA(Ile)-lysidine synthase
LLPEFEGWQPDKPFAVAVSGGADSTALLWAGVKRWPGLVHAVHINHGLQAAASDFEWHVRHLCQRWKVPLMVHAVQARAASGESPEDAARRARYLGLAQALGNAWNGQIKDLMLAQHADDQAETVLLALSRGAGLPGLAAMPLQTLRHGLRLHRPWLQASGLQLRLALRQHGIPWVEDPTNANLAFTRNRIRSQVLPQLEQAFTGIRATLARTASHAAQAQQLLNQLAELDALQVELPPKLASLQQLPANRQANLLRYWLASQGSQASAAQMNELLRQIHACTSRGHQISIKVGSGQICREGARLAWYN